MKFNGGALPEPTQEEWAHAISGDLVERLEAFAFQREKVLDKLDLRGAKAARALAMELRHIRRTLASKPRDMEDADTRQLLALFRELEPQAHDLLEGRRDVLELNPTTPPPHSAQRERDSDPDEITAARTPESIRTGSRGKRS
jgi:hypothetical protein